MRRDGRPTRRRRAPYPPAQVAAAAAAAAVPQYWESREEPAGRWFGKAVGCSVRTLGGLEVCELFEA